MTRQDFCCLQLVHLDSITCVRHHQRCLRFCAWLAGNIRSAWGPSLSCHDHFWIVTRANLSPCSKTVTLSVHSRQIRRNVKHASGVAESQEEPSWLVQILSESMYFCARLPLWPRHLWRLSSTESCTNATSKLIQHQGCRQARPALISASFICYTWTKGTFSLVIHDKALVMAAGSVERYFLFLRSESELITMNSQSYSLLPEEFRKSSRAKNVSRRHRWTVKKRQVERSPVCIRPLFVVEFPVHRSVLMVSDRLCLPGLCPVGLFTNLYCRLE